MGGWLRERSIYIRCRCVLFYGELRGIENDKAFGSADASAFHFLFLFFLGCGMIDNGKLFIEIKVFT